MLEFSVVDFLFLELVVRDLFLELVVCVFFLGDILLLELVVVGDFLELVVDLDFVVLELVGDFFLELLGVGGFVLELVDFVLVNLSFILVKLSFFVFRTVARSDSDSFVTFEYSSQHVLQRRHNCVESPQDVLGKHSSGL